MKIEEAIGANVSKLREAKGMSQTQLGDAVAIHLGKAWSRQAVSAAEKGRRSFTAADLLALSRILDTSVPELFLLKDWRTDQSVELSAGVRMNTVEYRERILHDLDERSASKFMTHSGLQELTETLLRMKVDQVKVGNDLDALLETLVYAGRVAGIFAEGQEPQARAALEGLRGSHQQEPPATTSDG